MFWLIQRTIQTIHYLNRAKQRGVMMSKEEYLKHMNNVGRLLTGLWMLSIICVIWFYNHPVAWKVFGTVTFLLIVCVAIVHHAENKIDDSIHP